MDVSVYCAFVNPMDIPQPFTTVNIRAVAISWRNIVACFYYLVRGNKLEPSPFDSSLLESGWVVNIEYMGLMDGQSGCSW